MKFIRSLFALFLVPAVVACAYVLLKTFLVFAGTSKTAYTPFWIGILAYVFFQIILYKPLRTYIFGHELTHAFAGILSGAKIKKFNVGKQSGSVVLNKDNVWITLSPYFFPIYTFIVVVAYIMLGWYMDIHKLYPYFLFCLGFTIAFHVALTIYILNIGQPDLKVYGVFFSYIVIFAINIIVFSLLMALAFPQEIKLENLGVVFYDNAVIVYTFLAHWIKEIFNAFTAR